jgi:hypothetical protein
MIAGNEVNFIRQRVAVTICRNGLMLLEDTERLDKNEGRGWSEVGKEVISELSSYVGQETRAYRAGLKKI